MELFSLLLKRNEAVTIFMSYFYYFSVSSVLIYEEDPGHSLTGDGVNDSGEHCRDKAKANY